MNSGRLILSPYQMDPYGGERLRSSHSQANFLERYSSIESEIDQQIPLMKKDLPIQEKVQTIVNLDNLADITLPGYAIKLIRHHGPLPFQDIANEVAKCYDALRRSDGSRYNGDFKKALKGSLSSSDIFQELDGNIWTIDENKAKIYEIKTTEKIKIVISKQKQKTAKKTSKEPGDVDLSKKKSKPEESGSSNGNNLGSLQQPIIPSLNTKRTYEEYESVFDVLNVSFKAFKMQNQIEYIAQNPFKEIRTGETLNHLSQKFGKDELKGVFQCFEYFQPILEDYINLKSGKHPNSS